MTNYWKTRELIERVRQFNLTRDDILCLLRKEYIRSYKRIEKELAELIAVLGPNPTADQLFREDKYYRLLNSISDKLEALGNLEQSILTSKFKKFYLSTVGAKYTQLLMPTEETVLKTINAVGAGDGMNFSDRIGRNKKLLTEQLRQGLVDTVATGRNWQEWSKEIKKTFNTGFFEAKRLVVTELSHIQSSATIDKYIAEGVEQVRGIAEPNCCAACEQYKNKVFPITKLPSIIPEHPNCRCTWLPVITVKGITLDITN